MIGNAVQDRAHAVLADPKANVAAFWVVAREILAVLDVVQCRSVQICAAAHKQRHSLRDRLQRFAARFARGQFRILRKFRNLGQKIDGNGSLDPVIERLRSVGIFLAPVGVNLLPASVVGEQPLFVLGKIFPGFLRDEIMFVWQTESFARGIDIFRAGLAVRFVRAGDFRNAFADESVRDDKLRFSVMATLANPIEETLPEFELLPT